MLKTKLGILQYLFLRCDKTWEKLSLQEKQFILQANLFFNNQRDDYKTPQNYGKSRVEGGENWDSLSNRKLLPRGAIIEKALEQIKPKSVLEIGPGGGFFTKQICEKPYVKEYVGLDIVKPFLDYLEPKLQKIKYQKKDFNFDLVCEDFFKLDYKNKFDLVVLLSTVHHIPNRNELFHKMWGVLKNQGFILAIDPSNYLMRKIHLFKNIPTYLKKSYQTPTHLSTHHFCSFEEYKSICLKNNYVIKEECYILPKKLFNKKIIYKHSFLRWLSNEMGILIQKI